MSFIGELSTLFKGLRGERARGEFEKRSLVCHSEGGQSPTEVFTNEPLESRQRFFRAKPYRHDKLMTRKRTPDAAV
ncbi:hypothetical protein [Helicobacter marmotae]|uniref:hypothetical protein n=1 Tax=Helicobacter marmotae TaxID=152490 RepID=UPI0011C074B8|nr:hypothetical protein [Helicobacter marmotae]